MRAAAGPDEPWDLPGGPAATPTPAEQRLRDLCRARVGLELGALAGLPHFEYGCGAHAVRYICFRAASEVDDALPLGYAELRWVRLTALRDYAFAPGLTAILAGHVDAGGQVP